MTLPSPSALTHFDSQGQALMVDVAAKAETHRIAMERLAKLVAQWLQTRGMSAVEANALVASDYAGGAQAANHAKTSDQPKAHLEAAIPQRQARHLAS